MDISSADPGKLMVIATRGVMAPNLFILGAPKCGTTALASWLGEHHLVYMPNTKEPHHYSSEYCLTPDRSAYEAIYRNWSDELWGIDASVWQLYSPNAIPNILRERDDARFIVMLRSPMQMIPSMHSQQVFNGNELEPDIGKALALNEARIEGKKAKVLSGYPSDHLAYYHSVRSWMAGRALHGESKGKTASYNSL